MSWLEIAGLPFQAIGAGLDENGRSFERSTNGEPIGSTGLGGITRDVRRFTHRMTDPDTARFWFRLLRGEGQVWSFEDNDDLSANKLPTVDPITPATDNPKWGTYHADRTGSDIDIIGGLTSDDFTVVYWYDDGNGYAHVVCTRLPGDVADRIWVNGIRDDAYVIPHIIAAGTFTLDTNGDFDDIVALPFGTPNGLAEVWPRFNAFSPLPKFTIAGDHWPARLCEIAEPPRMPTVNDGSSTGLHTVETALRAGPRADIFEPLPDFDGLTRIEWTVDALPGGHLSPVGSWFDIGPLALELTQTGSARPTYRNDGALGNTVRGDGSDDFLETASGLGLDFSGGLTWFSVHARSAYANNAGLIAARDDVQARSGQTFEVYQSTVNDRWVYAVNRSPSPIEFWFGIDTDLNTADPVLWSVRFDGTNLNAADAPVRQNGELISVSETGTPDGPSDDIDIIELFHGFNAAKFTGDIYDSVLYFGRAMTLAETVEVEQALNRRRGVY